MNEHLGPYTHKLIFEGSSLESRGLPGTAIGHNKSKSGYCIDMCLLSVYCVDVCPLSMYCVAICLHSMHCADGHSFC